MVAWPLVVLGLLLSPVGLGRARNTVDGKEAKTGTATGQFAIASCDNFGN
ncbi:hypothetical protein [Amycolatopsis thermophila]|uniref:Uncharacterized protein n=1 Tax=Amycolatopsis thermophila TaxID=206084 RepID=A0ABU0EPY3_9PSEU|nr:hypothetical protein [Amycolatopsis thermophila]MDQ0377312.1 hypothetical protein [Amycolatopsis thermophila]